MVSANHIREFDLDVVATPEQIYTAAFESASALGYSVLKLFEPHNVGAWAAFAAWLDKLGASSSLSSFTDGGETWQVLEARVGTVTIEVFRRKP